MTFYEIGEACLPLVDKIKRGENVDENFHLLSGEFSPIIDAIIKRTARPESISVDDLKQEALVALWRCCENYETGSASSFYCYFWVTASRTVQHYIYNYQLPITVTKHEAERTRDLRAFYKAFFNEQGKIPTLEQIEAAGFDRELAGRFLMLRSCNFVELDEDIENNIMEDEPFPYEEKTALLVALDKLEPDKKNVIVLRHLKEKTLKEVSEIMKISTSKVRDLESSALIELRDILS